MINADHLEWPEQELIECRACQAPYCNGCNMFTLSQALHKGYFDRFMEDGHHTIYIDTLKQGVGEWVY